MANELSAFDANAFLETTFEGAMSTKFLIPPAQDWPGTISKLSPPRKFTNNDGEEQAVFDVQWSIEDPKCHGGQKCFAKQTHWLDFKMENNMAVLDFDEGKNVSLGQLRDALGQNKEKGKWSPGMLMGQSAKIRVSHRPDKADQDIKYAEVKKVSALGS